MQFNDDFDYEYTREEKTDWFKAATYVALLLLVATFWLYVMSFVW